MNFHFSRSLKIGSLCVATAAISFIAWKRDGFHGSQKTAAVHQDVPKNSSVQLQQVAPTTVIASVHVPAPLHQPSDEELREFPGATVVEASETEGPEPGQKIHLRLLKTHFKYPLIRTKEIIDTNKNSVVAREEMAADHLLVTLPEGEDPQAFLKCFGSQAISMVRVTQDAPLYLLYLASSSLDALPQALVRAAVVNKGISGPDVMIHACKVPNDPDLQYERSLLKSFNKLNQRYLPGIGYINTGGGHTCSGIDAIDAWDIRTDASSIVVAVVDSGIRYTHEDLAANMWCNPAPTFGDIHGVRVLTNPQTGEILHDGDVMDGFGHGTHCAGIIGAVGDNGIGVCGVAWKVQLMACRFQDEYGTAIASDSIVVIDYAIEHGARILNCSWIATAFSRELLQAFQRARSAGVIIVDTAGNNAALNDEETPSYPANYRLDNMVTVTATTDEDTLASFSDYGVKTVHLAAPGVNICSTWADYDSDYSYDSGESFAAPFVTGTLALMMAQFPMESYQELIARLLAATDKIPALEGKTISGGRLNVAKALAATVAN